MLLEMTSSVKIFKAVAQGFTMLIPWVERFCPLVTRTCGGFLLNCLKEITYTTVCRRDGTSFLRQQWLFTRFIFVM